MDNFETLHAGVEFDASEPIEPTQVLFWPKSVSSPDALKWKWRLQTGTAKLSWEWLTDDQLMKLEAHAEKLTSLIQERYALTREAAARQVRDLFDQYAS
jgi:uncharacterized protein YjbJ (UPF0337 family)